MARVDDLSNEISRALQEYTTEVEEGLEEAKKEVAEEAVQKLKKAGGFRDLTGDYRKGWARKKVGTAQAVHNRTDYQLTHLLEFGHAKRGGGRTRAFPHIGPTEEWANEEFEKRVEKVVKG